MELQDIVEEELVLRRIFDDSTLQNKVLPHLNIDLFQDHANIILCKAILAAYEKYKRFVQPQDLLLHLPANSLERNKLLKIMKYNMERLDKQVVVDVIEKFISN